MIDNQIRKARWTTADELDFLREMYDHRNARALRRYIRLAHDRDWSGEGMSVDVDAVIAEAARLVSLIKTESPEELA